MEVPNTEGARRGKVIHCWSGNKTYVEIPNVWLKLSYRLNLERKALSFVTVRCYWDTRHLQPRGSWPLYSSRIDRWFCTVVSPSGTLPFPPDGISSLSVHPDLELSPSLHEWQASRCLHTWVSESLAEKSENNSPPTPWKYSHQEHATTEEAF